MCFHTLFPYSAHFRRPTQKFESFTADDYDRKYGEMPKHVLSKAELEMEDELDQFEAAWSRQQVSLYFKLLT